MSFSGYFRARAAINEAANLIVANPRRPDPQRLVAAFRRFDAGQGEPRVVLDRFMAEIDDTLRQRRIQPDPLILFSAKYTIARAASIAVL